MDALCCLLEALLKVICWNFGCLKLKGDILMVELRDLVRCEFVEIFSLYDMRVLDLWLDFGSRLLLRQYLTLFL